MNKFALVFSENCYDPIFEVVEKKFTNASLYTADSKIALFLDGDNHVAFQERTDGFSFSYGGNGNKNGISFLKENGDISIHNDILGSLPIYYFRSESILIVSNHMKLISQVTAVSCDYLGVFQFVCSAYTLSDRTLYSEVRQMRPGNTIGLNTKSGCSSFFMAENSSPWKSGIEVDPTSELIDAFVAKWSAQAEKLAGYQLMMSAGWDSRTLLSGVIASHVSDVSAYSHGDLKSREIAIANRICNSYSLPHTLKELNEDLLNLDLINRMLADNDSCMFPHWRVAAEFAKANSRSGITGGIFGEIIGGHYGILSVISQREQYKAMASYMFGLPSKYRVKNSSLAKDFAISSLCGPKYGPMWCFSDDFNNKINTELTASYKEQISEVINSYYLDGTVDLHRLVERFQVEHRARQYINCQLSVALPVCGINNPFADEDLVKLAVSFPVHRKLHNQLNIKIIKKLAPSLLDYSMAATLLPAKYPFVAQEASRVVRKLYESGSKYLRKDGALHMGWNNFDPLINGNLIPDIINSLHSNIWSRENMYSVFSKAHSNNIYPILDMFLKIKTVDNRLQN